METKIIIDLEKFPTDEIVKRIKGRLRDFCPSGTIKYMAQDYKTYAEITAVCDYTSEANAACTALTKEFYNYIIGINLKEID